MSRYSDPEDWNRPPEDLTAWLRAGMRRTEALAWRKWNFSLVEAEEWRAAGVLEALTAAQWQTAGVGIRTVAEWQAAGISAGEAVHWHEFGIGLEQAREHRKKGLNPDQVFSQQHGMQRGSSMTITGRMRGAGMGPGSLDKFFKAGVPHSAVSSYVNLQWFDDDAVGWAREGIAAWDARVWRSLGLVPAEAAELEKAELTPQEVIRQWWTAGIPYEEVADWLGAGLTAQEAAEQRASGATVEQAAALRALRRGGDAM